MNNFEKAEAIEDRYHCHDRRELAKMVVELQGEIDHLNGRVAELEEERDCQKESSRSRKKLLNSCRVRLSDAREQLDVALRREHELGAHVERVKDNAKADFIDGLLQNHLEFTHPEAGHIVDLLVKLETGLRQQANQDGKQ